MTKDTILGFVRHLLTFGGGFVTSAGFATNDEITIAVSAAVSLIGFGWSVYDKYKRA